jgi:hypothetical protein
MASVSFGLRVAGTLCFLLAVFSVSPEGYSMVPVGLALWCGSTLVP